MGMEIAGYHNVHSLAKATRAELMTGAVASQNILVHSDDLAYDFCDYVMASILRDRFSFILINPIHRLIL